ncbi:MAG: ROK family protein [Atopobiaceae bacterium]|nr:ROK family protein [Atopobiaceae bacterium]MDO4404345.1 ROK family protein [Atopobiaceae bacterium]
MEQQYLVLDIGGTFIKYAIMNREGQFLAQGKVEAKTGSEEEMLASLADVRDAVSDYDYEGVAISMPGRIDTARGWAHTGGAFTWLSEYPAAEKYGAVFGKPCTIANDGKCAAIAESWAGALADVDSGAVIVLGTGIGGGIVLNKQVWMGCSGGAGELSWLICDYPLLSDEAAEHISPAMWTGHISAHSITKEFARRKGLESADGIMLFDAYDAGDPDAIAVLNDYAIWAAAGIVNLQSVLDLQRYAIGGGISARPETTTLIRDAVEHIFAVREGLPFSKPEIVTCKFGNEANLIGALAFFLRNQK